MRLLSYRVRIHYTEDEAPGCLAREWTPADDLMKKGAWRPAHCCFEDLRVWLLEIESVEGERVLRWSSGCDIGVPINVELVRTAEAAIRAYERGEES